MVEGVVPTLKVDATTYPEHNREHEVPRCCGNSDGNYIWLKDELALELCVSSRMSGQEG